MKNFWKMWQAVEQLQATWGVGIAISVGGLVAAAGVVELVATSIQLASRIYYDKAEDANSCKEYKKYLTKAVKLHTLANDIGTFGYTAARRRRNGDPELDDLLEQIDHCTK